MHNIQEGDNERIGRLIGLMNAYWWEANYHLKTFRCSDQLAQLFGWSNQECSFENFFSSIRKDYKECVKDELMWVSVNKKLECTFPYQVSDELLWLRMLLCSTGTNERGEFVVEGLFRLIANQEQSNDFLQSYNRLKNLLFQQNQIAKSLFSFFDEDLHQSSVESILRNLSVQFKGGRVYIFEYDYVKCEQNCIYEVNSGDAKPQIDLLQAIPLDSTAWFTEQLTNSIPIILNNIDDLPPEAAFEQDLLSQQNIKSLVAIPMVSHNGICGYLGIDIVDDYHNWSNEEYQWIASLSNTISLCISLSRSESKAKKEREQMKILNEDLIEAHKALENSEKTLKRIYKSLPVGIELYDKDGYLIDINDRELEIFGVKDRNKLLGVNFNDNPNLCDEVKTAIRNGEDVDFTIRYNFDELSDYYETVQTGIKDIIGKSTPIFNSRNEKINTLIAVIDNSETTNAYSQLHEFENLFSVIGDFAKVGYFKWNPTVEEGFAIKQWYKNVCESEEGSLADIIGVYRNIHPEDRILLLDFYHRALNNEVNSFQTEVRVADGKLGWKWIRSNIMVKSLDVNDPLKMELIGVNFDITQLKETEEKLIAAKDKAETMDRLKSAFLANMSHEIRTPLNAIVGFSNLLVDTENAEERELYLSILQENNELLLQLISDILDLSKIESGAFDFTMGYVDLNSLCEELTLSLSIKVPEGVKLVFENRLNHCTIFSDRNRITQVLANFVNNAVKFTTEGSISLGYNLLDEELEFYVRDTGIGIASDKVDAVFERFVKLNNFVHGTGLGLSICQSIVVQMGGRIGVDSEEGVGSRFWFTLPLDVVRSNVELKHLALEQVVPLVSGKQYTILIAEDTESNYLLISSILRKDYILLRARDGVEAVKLHAEQKPDIILMDVKMPNMDGIEATTEIRKSDNRTPIIAVTAFAFDQDKQRVMEVGCNDYISKPIAQAKLRETLKKWLK